MGEKDEKGEEAIPGVAGIMRKKGPPSDSEKKAMWREGGRIAKKKGGTEVEWALQAGEGIKEHPTIETKGNSPYGDFPDAASKRQR